MGVERKRGRGSGGIGELGLEGTEQAVLDVTLETGVSTRQPITWIGLGVDEGGRKVDSE